MKFRNRIIIILTGLLPALAQSDITRADVYEIGDTADYFSVDATNAEPGPAGVGVTWDFSNLPRVPAEDYSIRFEAASAAPNSGQFPNANMVEIQNAGPTDAYTFYSVTNQRFTLEGLDIPDVGVVTYTNKNIWLDFPLGYSESQSDDFEGSYTFNVGGVSGTTHRTGNLTTLYDGYGTLILPDGTRIDNVRRLKMDQVVMDVVQTSGITITTTVTTTTYNFFAEDERLHVFHLTIGDTLVDPPGLATPAKVASYRTYEATPSFAAKRVGAHLTNQGGNFDSEILIRNTSDLEQQISLQPFSSDGGVLDPVAITLAGGASSRVLAQDYFSSEAKSFSISGCDACPTSVGYRAAVPDASTAQVHETDRLETELFFYPGEWESVFDGAALINTGDGQAHIDVLQIDDMGNVLDTKTLETALAPDGKHLTIFNDLFNNTPNTLIKILSSQPLAVMILRISDDGRYLYQNLPLPVAPEAGDARWLAHITSVSGDFDTDIYVHNTASESGTVVLTPFEKSGGQHESVEVTVEANATRRFARSDLFEPDASHAMISGSSSCLVTLGYRAQVENASTAAIHEAPPVGTSFDVYPGDWQLLFDGFALVNTGDAAAMITVRQIDNNGVEQASEVLVADLVPNAKYLGLLEGVIPEDPNTIIRIESSQPLAVLSLRLSKDSRFLYSNNPIPKKQ